MVVELVFKFNGVFFIICEYLGYVIFYISYIGLDLFYFLDVCMNNILFYVREFLMKRFYVLKNSSVI